MFYSNTFTLQLATLTLDTKVHVADNTSVKLNSKMQDSDQQHSIYTVWCCSQDANTLISKYFQ